METLNKKFLKKNKSAFTLVELIIVITILAILATIAFISFQGYSKNARDGNRLTTMKNIEKGIVLYNMKSGKYPQPDESINVEASGTLIGYQGIIGDTISRNIKMNITPKDPFDSSNYLYSVNSDNSKYQLLGYLETPDYLSLLNQSYAVDYSSRYVKTLGDKVGVILDTNKNPIIGVTKVDVATGSKVYNIYFGDSDSINGSGNILYSNIHNRRSDLINNKDVASLDSSLVVYWDMETLSGGKLRDFSKYGNDGTLGGGIVVGGIDGVKGKSTYFDGVDDMLTTNYNGSLNDIGAGDSTLNVLIKLNKFTNQGSSWVSIFGNTDSLTQLTYNARYNNGSLQLVLSGNAIAYNIQDKLNELTLFTIKKEKNIISIYIDGKLVVSKDIGVSNFSQNGLFYIGKQLGMPEYLNGVVDDIRLYNRALLDSEIQEIYNSIK